MKKYIFLIIILLLTIVAGLSINNDIPSKIFFGKKRCGISTALAASMPYEPITEWQRYDDLEYGISFEYPKGWDFKATIDQYPPYIDPFAIVRRLTFTGKEGIIDLDIWLPNDLSFIEWLEWYGNTRAPIPLADPNPLVVGKQVLAFIEGGQTVDLLTTFFSDDKYVYRLWYPIASNKIGLEAYQHILDTIMLSNKEATTSELPEAVLKDAQNALIESGLMTPLGDTCCGYSSPGNPFPCCQEGGVDKGNCTWWVYYMFGGVPFRGDAGTWYGQVPDYPTWRRGSVPSKWQDNIAWWSGSPGHVAFLPYYTGGTTITISEMLWCTSCYRTRTISATNPNGYMWTTYYK